MNLMWKLVLGDIVLMLASGVLLEVFFRMDILSGLQDILYLLCKLGTIALPALVIAAIWL